MKIEKRDIVTRALGDKARSAICKEFCFNGEHIQWLEGVKGDIVPGITGWTLMAKDSRPNSRKRIEVCLSMLWRASSAPITLHEAKKTCPLQKGVQEVLAMIVIEFKLLKVSTPQRRQGMERIMLNDVSKSQPERTTQFHQSATVHHERRGMVLNVRFELPNHSEYRTLRQQRWGCLRHLKQGITF
eukprot:6490677-Amphidinium_carterae.9